MFDKIKRKRKYQAYVEGETNVEGETKHAWHDVASQHTMGNARVYCELGLH